MSNSHALRPVANGWILDSQSFYIQFFVLDLYDIKHFLLLHNQI